MRPHPTSPFDAFDARRASAHLYPTHVNPALTWSSPRSSPNRAQARAASQAIARARAAAQAAAQKEAARHAAEVARFVAQNGLLKEHIARARELNVHYGVSSGGGMGRLYFNAG